MFLLAGHNTRLGSAMTFAAWVQACKDGDREREAKEWDEEAARLKNRHDESRRKYFMLMDDSRQGILIANVFPVWVKLVSELKKDKQHERQVMLMLFGNESRLVLTETVSAWAKLAEQSRQKLRHERKTMFLLAGHNARLGLSMTFAAWVQAVLICRRQRSAARRKEDAAQQK